MSDPPATRQRILLELEQGRWEEGLAGVRQIPEADLAREVDATLAGALILLLGEENRTRQRHAADTLAAIADRVPALARGLEDALASPRVRLRWGAAYTLGHAHIPPPPGIWPAVLETLACEDGDQRWAAAELTCALMRAHPTIRGEIGTSIANAPPTLRRMLLYCLRDVRDPDLCAHARAGLGDADPGVRLAALAAARVLASAPGNDSLADRIAAVLREDPDPGVRRAAAASLGKMRCHTPRVAAALAEACNAEDAGLARAATAARAALESTQPKN